MSTLSIQFFWRVLTKRSIPPWWSNNCCRLSYWQWVEGFHPCRSICPKFFDRCFYKDIAFRECRYQVTQLIRNRDTHWEVNNVFRFQNWNRIIFKFIYTESSNTNRQITEAIRFREDTITENEQESTWQGRLWVGLANSSRNLRE